MGRRVLIIDDFHEILSNGLKAHGFEVIDAGDCGASDVKRLLTLHRPEGLVVRSKLFVGEAILDCVNSLRWIARGGAGMDNIDESAADKKNIICFNAAEANSVALGEHAVGMLLALFTQLTKSHKEVIAGKWDREGNRGIELAGKTVGILGYGNTGSAVAKRLQGFDVRVIAYDKYKKGFANIGVEEVDETTLLCEADVLSLHVPLTSETQNWLTDNRLFQMKQSIWLLNLSRGGVLDLGIVERGLNTGKICGFAADVLEFEPPTQGDEEFQSVFLRVSQKSNVIFSPHVGGWTLESYKKISQILLDKILTY